MSCRDDFQKPDTLIGRALVRTTCSCEIRNDGVNDEGETSAQEWIDEKPLNTCRNLCAPVTGGLRKRLMGWVARDPDVRKQHERHAPAAAANAKMLDKLFGIGGTD
jgi:hypothetical protein